jgi:hypothetical protein
MTGSKCFRILILMTCGKIAAEITHARSLARRNVGDASGASGVAGVDQGLLVAEIVACTVTSRRRLGERQPTPKGAPL